MRSQHIEPVERATPTGGGSLRMTAGRAPERREHLPELSEAAHLLLVPLFEKRTVTNVDMVEFIKGLATPSRPGVEALGYLEALWRQCVADRYPDDTTGEMAMTDALHKLGESHRTYLDAVDALERSYAAHQKLLTESFARGVVAGAQAMQKKRDEDSTRPILVREVEFHEDSKGRITGKTEKEFKP